MPLLNSWEFNQLMLIRIGLEPIAAEASVKNATKSKILNIEKYFEQMKKLAKARNLSAYLRRKIFLVS